MFATYKCFVCHPIQLQHIDAHGKHKGVVGYNKNHGTHALNKYVCNEHPNLYKKWGSLKLQIVIKTQSEKQVSKKRKIVPFFQIIALFWQPIILQQIKSNAPPTT
jgi:hypothetical protein